MKQKLKRLKLLFSIILAGFLLYGCNAEEEYLKNNTQDKKLKISHKKYDDLANQENFTYALSKIANTKTGKNNDANKSITVMEDQYSFTISKDRVNVTETDLITSYTLFISRANSVPNEVENLIVQVKNNTKISAYILKYSSEREITQADFKTTTFQGHKTITPIIYNASPVNTFVQENICKRLYTWHCYGQMNHSSSDGCTMGYQTSELTCSSTSDGGSGDGGDGSSGSGGSDYSDPILTTPEFVSIETPCQELKKMTNNVNIRNTYTGPNGLQSKVNEPIEYGNAFFRGPNYDTTSILPNNPLKPNEISMKNAAGGKCYGANHSHPSSSFGWYPMFPMPDVKYLLDVARSYENGGQAKDFSIFVLTMTVPSGTFAIKIKDVTAFYTAVGSEKNYTRMVKELEDAYEDAGVYDMEGLTKTFLKFLDDNNMGAGLYQAEPGFASWNELSLSPTDPTNNPIVKTPCN